jgi:hypothetical protein
MHETLTMVLISAAVWLITFSVVVATQSVRQHRLLRRKVAHAAKKRSNHR